MEEIERMIKEINNDIAFIELPKIEKNVFFEKYPYSRSKLEKDFKKYTGKTLLKYLREKKIEYISTEKERNPNMSNYELMDKTNYKYDEKTLRNHLRTYREQTAEQSNADDAPYWDINFFHNVSIVSEILVRFLLLHKLAKTKVSKYKISVIHDVHNSPFQINGLFPIENKHCYEIFLDLDNLSLDFTGVMIKDYDSSGTYKTPVDMSIYISYLYTISMRFKKCFGYSLMNAIKNWQECNQSLTLNSIIELQKEPQYYHFSFPSKKNTPYLEINKKSKFIQDTDVLMEELKSKLLDKYNKFSMKKFKLPLDIFISYAKSVRAVDYEKMGMILHSIKRFNSSSIDALFSLTDCPYLVNIVNIVSDFNSEISSELYKCSKEQLIRYIIEYKKMIEERSENEDYDDYNPNEWFEGLKEKTV